MNKIAFLLILATALLCLSSGFAQFTISSGASVHVGDGVTMISQSDVKNQGTFKVVAGVFTLDASLTNTGTMDLSTATLKLGTSTSPAKTNSLDISDGTTPVSVKQLILDASSSSFIGVSLSSGILRVTESLESISGTLDAKGKIVLASTTATNAAQVLESSGGIVKDIVVERYIPSKRAFRLLASPVNSTGTINANLQEGQNNISGYGTHITGSTNGANGFDASATGNPSMFLFTETDQSWSAVPNTNVDKLQVGTAFRLMVRGDRSIDLSSNTSPSTATTLRVQGDLHIGDHSPTLATGVGEFSFIANPYQAIVDYSSMSKAGLKDFIYMWDAGYNDGGANPRGKYATIDLNNLSNNPVAGLLYTKYILPGQSFFVQNQETLTETPSLTFQEADKTAGQSIGASPYSISTDITSAVKLYKADVYQNGGNPSDAALLRFNTNYKTQADSEDATKMWNPDENIAVVNQGYRVIDKRNFPKEEEERISLVLNNYTSSDYRLEIELSETFPGSTMYLRDAFLETLTEIDPKLVYAFSVDQNTDSKNQDRFSLVFKQISLGLRNFESLSLNVYPNPTQGIVSIEASSSVEQIEVFDITGKSVYKASQTSTVDIHHLSVGVYLFQIQTSEGTSTRKVIKY